MRLFSIFTCNYSLRLLFLIGQNIYQLSSTKKKENKKNSVGRERGVADEF